jgi:hypothetical protein
VVGCAIGGVYLEFCGGKMKGNLNSRGPIGVVVTGCTACFNPGRACEYTIHMHLGLDGGYLGYEDR